MKIIGEAKAGQILSIKTILYSGVPSERPTLSYSWMRGNKADGGVFDSISGAVSDSYVVSEDDLGKYLLVKVTAEGAAQGIILSNVTGPVSE